MKLPLIYYKIFFNVCLKKFKKGGKKRVVNKRGFTLIEVIIVAGIIAILAGNLVPLIFKEIDEARITRVTADTKSISSAIFVFKKDTSQWPVMNGTCRPTLTLLSGDGNLPTNFNAQGFDDSDSSGHNDQLPQDLNGCYNNWKGPYSKSQY